MKKLFITDLDGTFLNSSAQVTTESMTKINNFIEKGGNFTFATARTASSAVQIMKNVNVNVPCILMNGVSIYDIKEKKYIKNEYFSAESAIRTSNIFSDCGVIPFLYNIEDEILYTYYCGFNCKEMEDFFNMRGNMPDRPFKKCTSIADEACEKTVYFSVQGAYENLLTVTKELDKFSDISYAFYKDVYAAHIWFLEVFSSRASKSNGVKFLKEYGKYNHITSFGDNLNDLPMFEVSDMKIAVSNAKDEVKAIADAVIGSNNENSVARWIEKNT